MASDLPAYTPAEATVFDDSFARDVFDPTLADHNSSWQRKLSVRTRHADAVVRARISTISRSRLPGNGSAWLHELVLSPLDQPLAGRVTGEAIAVQLAPHSPAYGLAGRAGSSLIGKTVILFFKRYDEEGKVVTHWRAEADTQAVINAVTVAAALDD